jgi:hypothetical protein
MKIAKVSVGFLGLSLLALSAMPAGNAAAEALRSASTCSLDECLASAQQTYTCCKNPDADGCLRDFTAALAPAKTCAQVFVSDVAECPGEVLTCEIEELGGGAKR